MKTTNEVNGIGTKTRDLDITMNGGNLQISRDTSNSKDLAFNVNGNGDYVINDGREVIYSQKSPVKAGESPGADEIFVKTNLREGSSYDMSSSYNINLNNGEYMLKDNLFEDRSGNVLVNANTPWENTVYNRLNSITTPDEIAEIEKITGNGTYRNWDFILKDEYLDKTIFDAAEGANISAATFASFAAGEGWFYSSNYDNNSNQYINTPWDKLKENYSTELLAGEVGLTGIAGYFNNLKEGGFIPPNSSLIYYDLLGTTKAKIKGEDVPTFFAGTIKYFESLAKESVGEEEWDNSTDSDKLALTTYIFNSGKPAGESIYNPVAVEKDYNGNNPLKNSKIREAMYLDFKNYLTYP
jgi:hypothetical protein